MVWASARNTDESRVFVGGSVSLNEGGIESSRKELMLEQGRSLESGVHLMREVSHQWRCVARGTRDVEFLIINCGKAPG